MSETPVVRPGETIGIIGGGQLARMLALAAAQFGLRAHIFAPDRDSPAFAVAAEHTIAAYDDTEALSRFAGHVAVATYEFENVPAAAIATVAAACPVHPNGRALAITQDRWLEKTFLHDLGLATAPFARVDAVKRLGHALAEIGCPALLKTRRFGYDGKGQVSIRVADDGPSAFTALGETGARSGAILEGFVSFEREVSLVGARGADGAFSAFDLCENRHEEHILATTTLPAKVERETEAAAAALARRIADALDYVGVIAVELFVTRENGAERLIVNEIAPRVHNSGHWTIEGAETSQFAQHIRAICGWPLGSPRRRGGIAMRNLIGTEAADWAGVLADPEAHLHLYGKSEARPGRKMGHVTRVIRET